MRNPPFVVETTRGVYAEIMFKVPRTSYRDAVKWYHILCTEKSSQIIRNLYADYWTYLYNNNNNSNDDWPPHPRARVDRTRPSPPAGFFFIFIRLQSLLYACVPPNRSTTTHRHYKYAFRLVNTVRICLLNINRRHWLSNATARFSRDYLLTTERVAPRDGVIIFPKAHAQRPFIKQPLVYVYYDRLFLGEGGGGCYSRESQWPLRSPCPPGSFSTATTDVANLKDVQRNNELTFQHLTVCGWLVIRFSTRK